MMVAGSGSRVVVATRPVDFRKGHDGLAALVEHELGLDPYSGIVFVFRPKRVDRIKVLWWEPTSRCQATLDRSINGDLEREVRERQRSLPPSMYILGYRDGDGEHGDIEKRLSGRELGLPDPTHATRDDFVSHAAGFIVNSSMRSAMRWDASRSWAMVQSAA